MSSSQLLRSNGTLLFVSDARRQLAAGESRRAIETCKRGLARHPDHAAGYVVLAAAYRSIGESGRARLVLRRGFERTGLARLRDLAEEIPAHESAKNFERAASAAVEVRVASAMTASRPIAVSPVVDERTFEQTVAEQIAAEQTVAERTVAEQIVTEQIVTDQIAAEQIPPEQIATEQIATEQIAAEHRVTEQTAAERAITEPIVAPQFAAQQTAEEQMPAAQTATETPAVEEQSVESPASEALLVEDKAVETHAIEVPDEVVPVSEGSSTAIPQIDDLSEPTDDDVAIDGDDDMVAGILGKVGEFMHAAAREDVSPFGLDETDETRVVERVESESFVEELKTESVVEQPEAVSVAAHARPQSDIATEQVPGLPPIEEVLPEVSDAPPLDALSAEETHSPLELVEERDDAANAVEQLHSELEGVSARADEHDDAAIAVEQAHSELEVVSARDEESDDDAANIVEESHSDVESIGAGADDRDQDAIAVEHAHSELEIARADDRVEDALAVEQAHSELGVVSDERDDDAALPTVTSGVAPEPPAERPVDRSHERIPWFPRRVPRPSERPQGSSLALHSGKSAHRLTSANLRLIPGLEYAPLRAEDQGRRMMIAPIMEEPLPDWEPRRRTITVTNAPPLPEYPAVVPDAMTAAAQAAPTASAPDVPDSISLRARESDVPTVQSPTGAPSMDVGVGQMRESRQSQHIRPTQPGEKASVVEASTSTADAAVVETDTSAIDELARRLEGARIAPVGEASTAQRPVFEPSIVSDTLADILVAQGAFGEAMKAFMTLARMRPSQLAYYEERIAEMKRRIVEAGNGDQ